METVDLIMRLEDEFDIEIPDDDAEQLLTIGNIADYIARQSNVPVEKQSALWDQVREVVSDESGVPAENIQRESRIIGDIYER